MWESSLRWTQLSDGLFFCIDVELWWAWWVVSISQGCQLYGLVWGMRYNLSNWCSLWATQLVFWKTVINFNLGHHSADNRKWHRPWFFNYFCAYNHRPSIVFLALWIQCCWPWVVCQFFVCARNILMIKCRPVYLFNFFSVENPCLVMPCGNVVIFLHSFLMNWEFFTEKVLDCCHGLF